MPTPAAQGMRLTGRGRRAARRAWILAACSFVLGVVAGASADAGLHLPAATHLRPPGGPVSIVWGGDTTLGSYRGLPPRHGKSQLKRVAPVLRAADLAVVNLEGTFGPADTAKCGAGVSATCFPFQAPAKNAGALSWAGVDLVNTANNHAYDYLAKGWVATRAALIRARVQATGAIDEVRVIERNGTRVAFVGFSTYKWSANMSDLPQVRALVASAARQADVVVVLMHAGAEGADLIHVPEGREEAYGEDRGDSRLFARTAVDAGADLVLGSGPHVLRGMQVYKGRLIAYSLGNLAGWHNFSAHGNLALSALLRVDLAPDGALSRGRVVSLKLVGAGIPVRDRGGEAERLMRVLSRQDFGRASPWPKHARGAFGPHSP
ncbi:MAG: hypothetical protein QOH76_1898 [Thermoleophilaceae bacterium]|nr:hypothetical protein [Thermoleophilaceae bacterium]